MSTNREPGDTTIQSLIEALSISLDRPVLLDDPELTPLAFSRQWEVDAVRSQSILSREVPASVREELLSQGIREAEDVVRIPEDRSLGMEERACLPVRHNGTLLGYLWLLDPRTNLTDRDLESLRRAGREIGIRLGEISHRDVADEAELFANLRSSQPEARDAAIARMRERDLLQEGPLVLCLVASRAPGADPLAAVRRAARRLSVGDGLAARTGDRAGLLASLADPVLRALSENEVGVWLAAVSDPGVAVGQSAPTSLPALDVAFRQAAAALRVALAGTPDVGAVAWGNLGADRLVAHLPENALDDIPQSLARLLETDAVLSNTLASYLDAAGDVQSAAQALSLHRSGLYYRLHRIEELTGLDLGHGDDRLLAHLAIRAWRLANRGPEGS